MSPTVFVLLLLATSCFATTFQCPSACKCKWSGGKRVADCSRAGLSTVPVGLSSDTQILLMDGNPLYKLEKNVFKQAGILNLQRISLTGCQLTDVHEDAFRDLKIMVELDLSQNNLTKIHPKTFDGNDRLMTLKMQHNPITGLMQYQFPPLRNLKSVDFSHCHLSFIDRKCFMNLGSSVESVYINDNRLKSLREEVFLPLVNLKSLQLHDNPWTCDCRLKNFRDWVVERRLYNRPTACLEPERLTNRMWDDIVPQDFACKPEIAVPFERVYGALGVNATLACRITGSPVPIARWVVNGRIVNNNTSPAAFSPQVYMIREQGISFDRIERWYNLTITNPSYDDLGKYTCVAENNGGVMEKEVTLTFDDPWTDTAANISNDEWTLIIGATAASIVFVVLVILVCCCCVCRKKKSKDNEQEKERNGYAGYEARERLLGVEANPVPKPPRMGEYAGVPQTEIMDFRSSGYVAGDKFDLEMTDARAPSVISNKPSTSSSSDGGAVSRASYDQDSQYPDLLDIPNRYKQSSPTDSGSTAPDSSRLQQPLNAAAYMYPSPFQRSGTLPIHHGRSVSYDHSNQISPAQHHQFVPQFHHHHPQHQRQFPIVHQQQSNQRPGYVTLPRRPRSSWSAPPTRDTPSPSYHNRSFGAAEREPIYDGIGPRTSADGSSRLSLNKLQSGTMPRHHQVGPLSPPFANPRYTLPPYYAPIEELQECPPTPKEQQSRMQANLPKSTPNILSLKSTKKTDTTNESLPTSSSETTLVEENLSSYCEPFGKALPPDLKTPGNRNSATSAESELEMLVPSDDKTNNNSENNNSQTDASQLDNRVNNNVTNVSTVVNNGGPVSSTPVRNDHVNGNPSPVTHVNGVSPNVTKIEQPRKVPPKTLPKPKAKPVVPPKPKEPRPKVYQDEGADGSEV